MTVAKRKRRRNRKLLVRLTEVIKIEKKQTIIECDFHQKKKVILVESGQRDVFYQTLLATSDLTRGRVGNPMSLNTRRAQGAVLFKDGE